MSADQGIFTEDDSTSDNNQAADEGVILSVVENRNREVCIARFQGGAGAELEVYVFADSHSYVETTMTLKALSPAEILLPDSTRGSTLSKKIEEDVAANRQAGIGNTRVVYISRMYYDQDRGAETLSTVVAGNVDADLVAKYTVLAGCYCLLRYVENVTGSTFAPNSLRLSFRTGAADRISIDRRTAAALEIISSLRDGNQKESLYGFLHYTSTQMGDRLLKANLLRPLDELSTLQMRQSLVALLLNDQRASKSCISLLRSMPDLDTMLDGLCKIPKKITDRAVARGIDTMLMLREALNVAGQLSNTLRVMVADVTEVRGEAPGSLASEKESNGIQLASAIAEALTPDVSSDLAAIVENALDPHAIYSRGVSNLRHAECFAVRTGVSGLLDLARSTYLASLEAMEAEVAVLSEKVGRQVRLVQSASRGHYLSLQARPEQLPLEFVQVVQGKKLLSCSTARISALSQRAEEALGTALRLTYQSLQGLAQNARQHTAALFSLADGTALLDMLLAFAEAVARHPSGFTRPILTTDPAANLDIEGACHPIVASSSAFVAQRGGGFVSNDLKMGPSANVLLVSGPNGSGKSVYVRQVALCVILAQIGMFVPAKRAVVPLRDRIIARMGPSDDIEYNVSSFRGEMKELAYLTANITTRTLAILDELGRGTSNIEGLSLAFATAEWLAMRPAFTLFVTHFPQLFVLPSMYATTRCVHMRTTGREGLSFIHKVGSGPSELQSGYGVKMARVCGFPAALAERAEALRIQVQLRHPLELTQARARPEPSETVAGPLLHYLTLLGASSLTGTALRTALSTLRARVQPSALQALLEQLANVVSPEQSTSTDASLSNDADRADKRQRTNLQASELRDSSASEDRAVFDEEDN